MKKILIIIGIIVVVIGIYVFGTYNRLVKLDETSTNQFKQIEVQYQRRFDLIPNLVAAVQGVMNQEKTVFANLAEARSRYAGAANPNDKIRAASDMDAALGRLLVVVEQYPVLKSSENVQALMAELAGTENRIAVARKDYNDAVKAYNLVTRQAPSSLVARMFGFSEKVYFESEEAAAKAPKVELI